MKYADSDKMPKTFEAYRDRALAESRVTADQAQAILRARGVTGRSKLSADAARKKAREVDGDAYDALVLENARLYRWVVAHGLEVSYEELEEIERDAGVSIVTGDGTERGSYATLEDAERVFAAASRHKDAWTSIRLRLSYARPSERAAADRVLAHMKSAFEVVGERVYDDGGGRSIYATVLLPRVDE